MTESPENGPVHRLAEETRALVNDVKEWTEVRVQLLQVEIEERLRGAANEVLTGILVVMLMSGAVLFLSLAVAFALGEWLGSPAWGLLIVGGVFAMVAGAVRSARPDIASRLGRDVTSEPLPPALEEKRDEQ